MGRYLSDDEIHELLLKVKEGNEEAWECLYENFEAYVHERSWKKLRKFDLTETVKMDVEMDLFQAGWYGFISAVKNFNQERGKFLTYATYYIDGEISKELDFRFNPLGLTNRPDDKSHISRVSLDDEGGIYDREVRGRLYSNQAAAYKKDAPNRGKYSAERRVLQILDILKLLTDENHNLSKEELGKLLSVYRIQKYDNGTPLESPNTLTSTMENMLLELNPEEYSKEREKEYRVKYEGYTEDRLKNKHGREKGKKSADITGFSYVHKFSFDELDRLIQLICFSDMFEESEKNHLVQKLISTSSTYYRTPFWNGKQLQFNPGAIHGRFSTRRPGENHKAAGNLQVIQYAINNLVQINFRFNQYTAEHEMIPKSDYVHILSPYHLVVYHDNYYCIGLKKDDKRIWHYRVDLMTDVEVVKDDAGKSVPVEITPFAGNPICNSSWNPEKYMAEHLNMAYDEPQDIRIKIRNTDYTILHDWFGNHYEKTDEPCEEGYDIVLVRTSPNMIVHWAIQYGTAVEIMDEEIRNRISEELRAMTKTYSIFANRRH
ncbi:hypothetical protein HMPREF9099_00514 [Lachnospiraceae bacterium oral taxon 082 str. F0431]|nr:hypothetical protein HMPREF9099_00514 [Lachnospiraceae bacterium oral taxon 082 str. F0431]